ncbi:MAG: hypothetical protein AB7S38_31265 [Vulcanimicrobiota bacterium]
MIDFERVTGEDLVTFINACFACTGQAEFYSGASEQAVSIAFLHEYIRVNYRRLYALTLAAGINHFNTAEIVFGLLATGADTRANDRQLENSLIRSALRGLPPQRAYGLFRRLAHEKVNNRRSRAVMRDYFRGRREPDFDLVKYRRKLRPAVTHAHLGLEAEQASFLFRGARQRRYQRPLFETFRQAHYQKEAVYRLPYTIAEGLAARHGIDRQRFLAGIDHQLTDRERLRLQKAGARAFDLKRASLTELAVYALSLAPSERAGLHQALSEAASRLVPSFGLGRVAAVLDCSYSSSGSRAKRNRPLAVALGVHYVLSHNPDYRAFWTQPKAVPLELVAAGSTDLAGPLVEALAGQPELVIIVSDGHENDPPGAVSEVVRLYRGWGGKASVIHLNPVFSPEDYLPRPLGPNLPTLGLGRVEDLATAIGFARFAEGRLGLAQLEAYLEGRIPC